MTNEEDDIIRAVYDLADGEPELVTYDQIAFQLGTTMTAVEMLSGLLQRRNLAVVTLAGLQLTGTGQEYARLERRG